ncbi:NADPH:quinone oxidoreductase family protein [Salicibibacter halophilus]|uniref:NADPH:quinone oxidoreductase family protein n=1 Tax=Salicibibacter halophilus TaxID=2502791 RepID=A0A514LG50_9BACI|nr:NADPH:quinone oxidoreductase family protein [Salicibibacter halophilus]QDI90515.1 NADPH:quinone oxidoreductase family protein [Salicibibacter halophilus]
MRAWQVKELADPAQALALEELEKPEREEGQVLIKTQTAALNFFDILLCQGKYQEKPPLPFTPGAEIAGTVEAADSGSDFQVGQKVLARPALPNGGFAEWVSVPEASVFRVPESMSFQEAAAMYITYQTACYALHDRANIKTGDVLLVHAGSGGVGSAAIQLGKAVGARVIATAGGPEKVQVCKDLGADVAIDYKAEDFVDTVKKETDGRGADIIFDPVGSDTFDRSRKCINFAGRILVVGFAGGRIPEAPTNHALVKNYSIVGVHWGYFAKLYEDEMIRMHHTLCDMYEAGEIKPLIYDEFPFEEVPHALDLLGDRKTYGKVVVDVGGEA